MSLLQGTPYCIKFAIHPQIFLEGLTSNLTDLPTEFIGKIKFIHISGLIWFPRISLMKFMIEFHNCENNFVKEITSLRISGHF